MKPWPQKALLGDDEHARKNPPGRIKPTLRRCTWSRQHAEVVTSDLWGLVADMAGASRDRVEAFVARLEVYANANTPRGSVEGFSIRALAVTWRCDAEQLARIYAALEEPEIGWLDQDHVVTFWERNPDQEDPTAGERAKRYRARKKNAQLQSVRRAEKEAGKAGFPQVGRVTRDDRDVTARSDQTNRKLGVGENALPRPAEAPQAVQRDSGESAENLSETEQAELWLATDGVRLVTTRLDEQRHRAEQRIQRWRASLFDDPCLLRRILDQAAQGDLATARFLVTVTDAIERARRDPNQRVLPLAGIVPARPEAKRRANDG